MKIPTTWDTCMSWNCCCLPLYSWRESTNATINTSVNQMNGTFLCFVSTVQCFLDYLTFIPNKYVSHLNMLRSSQLPRGTELNKNCVQRSWPKWPKMPKKNRCILRKLQNVPQTSLNKYCFISQKAVFIDDTFCLDKCSYN